METSKFSLVKLCFCILLLSLPLVFAHDKMCPAECVCSCPANPGQSPPSNDQNQPPSGGDSPPSNDQNQPPPGGDSPPSNDQNQPPPGGDSPPSNDQNQPPPGGDSPPSNDQNQPPLGGDSPPSNDQPPSGGDSPPSNDQSPSGRDSPPSNDQPPSGGDSPPSNDQNVPPPTQESSPPSDGNQPPASQESPPSNDQSQGSPPATPDNGAPPTQESNSPPSGQESSPPTTPQYGQAPPTSQTPSQGSVGGGGSFSGSFNATFKGSFKRICAFGDSFTDTGNAFLSGGLKAFAAGSYSSGSSGQRMSNGRLVIDFLCDALDLPPLPAYKKSSANFSAGVNFATAGSTGLSADFFAKGQISHTLMWRNPLSFTTQLNWFNDFIQRLACKGKSDADCRAEMEGTLFWIGEFGGNDYSRAFGSRIKFNFLQQMAIGHVTRTITAMIARGAKYIVVQGLPPAGCCPLEMALRGRNDLDPTGCSSIGNSMVKAHNALLMRKIAMFRQLNPGCTIVYADTWNAYKTILSNHRKFGFTEPFKACCGAGGGLFNFKPDLLCGAKGTTMCRNPQQFMSWDGIHMTEAMHKQIAELFFHGSFCQPSFGDLIKAKIAHRVIAH